MPSCGKPITTPLDGLVDKYYDYTSKIMDLALSIDIIEHTSYRNKSKLFNKELGLTMHRSAVYRHKIKRFRHYSLAKIKGIQNLLKEKNIQLSGVYNDGMKKAVFQQEIEIQTRMPGMKSQNMPTHKICNLTLKSSNK